jgi:hypothetical protein
MKTKVHYKESNGDGIPDFYLCSPYGGVPAYDDRMTKKPELVTCKRCLKIIPNVRAMVERAKLNMGSLDLEFLVETKTLLSEIPVWNRNGFLRRAEYWDQMSFQWFWELVKMGQMTDHMEASEK